MLWHVLRWSHPEGNPHRSCLQFDPFAFFPLHFINRIISNEQASELFQITIHSPTLNRPVPSCRPWELYNYKLWSKLQKRLRLIIAELSSLEPKIHMHHDSKVESMIHLGKSHFSAILHSTYFSVVDFRSYCRPTCSQSTSHCHAHLWKNRQSLPDTNWRVECAQWAVTIVTQPTESTTKLVQRTRTTKREGDNAVGLTTVHKPYNYIQPSSIVCSVNARQSIKRLRV